MTANGPALLGIPQISTTVPNLEEAIQFYQGDLGLPLLFKTGAIAMFACGSTRLMVATHDQNPTKQQTFVYFAVDDIAKAKTHLATKGIRFHEEPHTVGQFNGRDVWLASFFDRGGSILHLMSEVPAAATTAKATPARA